MTIVESLEHHRDSCTSCGSGNVCAVARELIDRLADRLVPQSAPEIVDFEEAGEQCANEGIRTLFAKAKSSQKVGKA